MDQWTTSSQSVLNRQGLCRRNPQERRSIRKSPKRLGPERPTRDFRLTTCPQPRLRWLPARWLPPVVRPTGISQRAGTSQAQPEGRSLVAAALVLVGAGAGAGIAYVSDRIRARRQDWSPRRPGIRSPTAQIAAAVDPAVVDINTNLGEGTGMIATSNGEIITNTMSSQRERASSHG